MQPDTRNERRRLTDKPPSESKERKPAVMLFDIPVQPHSMEEVLDTVDAAISKRARLDIGVVNAAKIVNMHKKPELWDAVASSDVIYADGMSVVWASRILGKPLPERIAGIDLMHEILKRGKGLRVYLLGAKQAVLDVVRLRFAADYPAIEIVGATNGYFSESDESQVASSIRDAKADVLFVAITSPKKELFMSRWADVMNVPVVHGVGGSFDVVAGVVKRAPETWQRLGLEWLYRVLQEPRRMWKRYLVTNTIFLGMLLRERLQPQRRRRTT